MFGWPMKTDLEVKNDYVLKNLRLKKIEWRDDGRYIHDFRMTLSDGSTSKEEGIDNVNQSYEFPDNRPIRKVEFKYYE